MILGHMAGAEQAMSADKDLQKLLPQYITINAAHHSIYYDNTSPSEQRHLTLYKTSYNTDFRREGHVGRDSEMMTKGYKQAWKPRRRLSFSISNPSLSLSFSFYVVYFLFLIHTPEGSPGDYPVPRWTCL